LRHPELVEDHQEHIVQAIERATRYVGPLKNAAALRQSEQIQDAVVRNIEIIGEAAGRIQRIDPEFVATHSELPWTEMRGIRNRMIHEYFDMDWDVVWGTVRDDLPPLKKQIEAVLVKRRHVPVVESPVGPP
jgi:uncharacterized protein with HEPN domain